MKLGIGFTHEWRVHGNILWEDSEATYLYSSDLLHLLNDLSLLICREEVRNITGV